MFLGMLVGWGMRVGRVFCWGALFSSSYQHFYSEPTALNNLQLILEAATRIFAVEVQRTDEAPTMDPSPDDWYLMQFHWRLPNPRPTPRCLYVLHLFSGVKREGDVHGFVANLPPTESGAVYCPISVDVALDHIHGDLLNKRTQKFWLQKAKDGFLFFVLCGPPCESWSIARYRFLLEGTGPRPLRASEPTRALWGLPQLRLREIRQIAFANSLLQFSLLILASQLSAGNYGLMEHPACPDRKCDRQPPSVWILPCVLLMLKHSSANLVTLLQGQYGARSPKTDYVSGYRTAWSLYFYGACLATFHYEITRPSSPADGQATIRWLCNRTAQTLSQRTVPCNLSNDSGGRWYSRFNSPFKRWWSTRRSRCSAERIRQRTWRSSWWRWFLRHGSYAG